MKKRILIVGASVMLCLFGGCLTATPLTDEEMDVVAEYAASLLLKYDKKYDTPLYYSEEREERLTPTPVATPTPGSSSVPGSSAATPSTQVDSSDNKNNPSAGGSTVTPTLTPVMYNAAETSRQLTEILAVDGITVTCEGYKLLKSVQSTEYFSLIAKEGRQYAVVSFLLHNNTNKDLVFDASGNGLEYSIDINTNSSSRVSLSMLENDLQYMEIPVPANGTAEAVLVFEIADTEIDTIHLIVENESDDTVFAKLK